MSALAPIRASREAGLALEEVARPAAPVKAELVTDEQQAIIAQRMELLAPMRERRNGCSLSEVVEQVASARQISKATVWRLYGAWKRGGPQALAPRPRGPEPGSGLRIRRHSILGRFVLAKWNEAGSISVIRDAARREWGGPLLPFKKKPRPPSWGAIRRFMDSVPPAIRDIERLAKQKHDAKYAPYLKTRRGEFLRPNERWTADHRISDVLVINDCFPGAPAGAAIRLWGTCVQDERTRVVVGWVWSVAPSSQTIMSAIRQGVGRFGMPETLGFDNGKEFLKAGELLAALGIKVHHCTPRHPQAKAVEAFFKYVAERLDKLFSRRGYTGSKPEMRPDFCGEAEKGHKELLAGKRKQSPLCTASRFMAAHAQFLKEYNETWQHGGDGMEGRAPMVVMDELLPAAQRRIPDMAEIAPFFWDVQKRKVTNCKIQLNKLTYSAAPDDAEGQAKMYTANGSTVAVRWDPNDVAYALAFENRPSGALLARLVSDNLTVQGPVTQDQIKAMCRERAKQRKAGRKTMEAMSSGVPSEIALLAQRAGLPAEQPFSLAQLPRPKALPPRVKTWACDVTDEDAELIAGVELED